MADVRINRITNANLYTGGKNFIGRAEEIDLGDLKVKMSEHKAVGMIGTIELPAGFDKLEGKIKWNSFYDDAFDNVANPYAARQIQVRANVETYDATGRTAETPLVMLMTVYFKNLPLGKFKQHDNVEMESMMAMTSAKIMYNGQVKLDYDAMANIYLVNGVDIFANYHTNTGA